jgi:hypothetical protein
MKAEAVEADAEKLDKRSHRARGLARRRRQDDGGDRSRRRKSKCSFHSSEAAAPLPPLEMAGWTARDRVSKTKLTHASCALLLGNGGVKLSSCSHEVGLDNAQHDADRHERHDDALAA